MKKFISALLALCMVVMLVPAFAEDDITGTWYLTRANAAGVSMVVVSDEIEMIIVIREDGTASLHSAFPGQEAQDAECAWTFDGGIISFIDPETETTTFAGYADGEILITAEGAELFLTREQYTPYVMAAAVKADSVEAFYGTWVPDISFQSGMMASLGDTMPPEERAKTVVSAEGIVETATDGTVTVYENPVLDPETGVLSASFVVELSGQTYETTMEMTLLEDGTMLVTASVFGYEVVRAIYIRFPAAEDAA